MISLEEFESKLRLFPSDYMQHFDEFWLRKLQIENSDKHVLDDTHREETGDILLPVLRCWRTYRPLVISEDTFLNCLGKISAAYNQIRNYSLLEFEQIPRQALELIWHELGCLKQPHERKNAEGWYTLVSVCKPLTLLWGQTLPFDTNNRLNIPSKYCLSKDDRRCDFRTWFSIMEKLEEDLSQDKQAIEYFKKLSRKKYGSASIVPYGRFLDIYFF